VAMVVDEEYDGRGIATFLFGLLVRHARARGLEGFTADVLASNKAMIRVIEKLGLRTKACLEDGAYSMTLWLDATSS